MLADIYNIFFFFFFIFRAKVESKRTVFAYL